MPRASRYLLPGYSYHLTHRCHDRRFLLRFARDRDVYRKWLWTAIRRHQVPVYNYCITSNHVHVVVHVENVEDVSKLMHLPSGAYAQQLNRRKSHQGSVWEHPYQCTLIQDGQHLLNCIRYVSMNMVRAGQVGTPSQWRWCAHDELVGKRSRYRILNLDRLLESLDLNTAEELRLIYEDGIKEMLDQREFTRKPEWTEALAVGDRAFVERIARNYGNRTNFSYEGLGVGEYDQGWAVRESPDPYSSFSGVKNSF